MNETDPRFKELAERRANLNMVKRINDKLTETNKLKRKELTQIYLSDLKIHLDK